MKTYYNRTVLTSDGKEVTRKVVEKNGVAKVAYKGTEQEVTPVGNPLDKQTKWNVKRAAQA